MIPLCIFSDLESFKNVMTKYDNDLSRIVNDDFHIRNETLQVTVGENIRSIYTEGLFQDDLASSVRVTDFYVSGSLIIIIIHIFQFTSDCRYTTNIIKYAQMVSKFADVYFYQFSYDGELGNVKAYIEGKIFF